MHLSTRPFAKSMVPHARRANQIRVISQRSQRQFHLFKRNESAALADHFADTIEKKCGTPHYAAAKYDHVWNKEINQIRDTQAEIITFAFDRSQRKFIATLGETAN